MPRVPFKGGLFMMLVDLVCATLTAKETPVGIVTSLVGAPLYLMLLNRVRKTCYRMAQAGDEGACREKQQRASVGRLLI